MINASESQTLNLNLLPNCESKKGFTDETRFSGGGVLHSSFDFEVLV